MRDLGRLVRGGIIYKKKEGRGDAGNSLNQQIIVFERGSLQLWEYSYNRSGLWDLHCSLE